MDFDILNRIGDVMKRCVIAQDTTELWELLEPTAELRGFQSDGGDISEAVAMGQAAPKSVRGARNVGRCTERIFAWMSHGPCIQQPTIEAEVKRRKVVQKDTTAASVAAPSMAASAKAGTAAAGAAAPHARTQRAMIQEIAAAPDASAFSTVTVTYGRPDLTLIDVLFVSEEGRVALITRRLADPPTDPKPFAAWQRECASFLHKTRQTVNALHTRPPALDFTFTGVCEPSDLLRLQPVSGRAHRAAPIETKRDENSSHSDFMQGPGGKPKKQLIKARNRDGEEEAYEFSVDGGGRIPDGIPAADGAAGGGNKEEERLRALAAELGNKYVAEAVRVSSNSMTDGRAIVRVLRSLVSNYYMSIQWLDLSCNKLAFLPSLETLPLTTLYLHSNSLSDWKEMEKLTQLKGLTAVTLFGNPIATETPDYKSVALAMLLNVKNKSAPLKSLDFVALSAVDRSLSEHHVRRNGGHTLPSPRRGGRSLTPRR